jgi:hypothetical protein
MPFAYAGAAAAVGSFALNAANSGGGSSSGFAGGAGVSPTFIPTGQAQADQNFQGITGSMFNTGQSIPQTVVPTLQSATNNLSNNPYAGLAQATSNQASGFGLGTLAPQLEANSGALSQAGNQVMGTAFDPQMALYNRTLQGVTDQSNAINSMYGLSSSPAGAGLTNQAIGNFNIDWQNQQLARQQAGIQSGGQAFAGAGDLGVAGMGTTQQAGALPAATFAGNQQNIVNAQNALSSGANNAFALDQNTLTALANYLRLGQTATQTANTGQAQTFGQNQILGQQAGSALSSLGSLFGKSGGSNAYGLGGGLSSAGEVTNVTNIPQAGSFGAGFY